MAGLVPQDFVVPTTLDTPRFRLRPLGIHDVVRDYLAVMSSLERLQGAFGPNSTWPTADLTIEQNLIDMGWHQKEFQRRSSFTYAVMAPDSAGMEIGCTYLYPATRQGWDVEAYLWIRAGDDADALDQELYEVVQAWLGRDWPFERVAFPGRNLSWSDWERGTS